MHPLTWPFRLFSFSLSILPRRIFLLMGSELGRLLRWFGFRRSVVEENLSLAFPKWTANERADFLRKNYQHYGILFLEILRFFFRFDRFLDHYCEVEGGENVRRALAKGKGAFVMTAHLGNWEVLTGCGAYRLKVPCTMVTKRLKPAWLHNLAESTRARLGVKMAFEPKTMQGVLRGLKSNGLVGFVMDQYTGAPVGARVPFFGVPVGSQTALAMLALRTGASVIPAVAYRRPDGRYVARFEPELPVIQHPDIDQAVLLNTAQFVAHTERWIREWPEQWLWIHRRWKGDLSALPPNCPGEMLK